MTVSRPPVLSETVPQSFLRRSREVLGDILHSKRWEGIIAQTMITEAERAQLCIEAQRSRGYLTSLTGALSHGGGSANLVVAGHGLIPAGWRQARATLVQGANATGIWEAIRPGAKGNGISIVYVNNGAGTAESWAASTRTVTVALNLAGGGDTLANVAAALAGSATGAQYVVQLRYAYGNSGAGNVTTADTQLLAGGTGVELLAGSLIFAEAANKDIEFVRRDVGLDAKPVYVSYVHLGGMTTLPTVAVTEIAARVDIVVTATIATHTAAHILQALRDSADAQKWISCRLAYGNSGAGTPAAHAATLIPDTVGTTYDSGATGGQANDEGIPISIGDLIPVHLQTLTDDGFTFDQAAGVGAAGTAVQVRVRICGVTYELSAVTAA